MFISHSIEWKLRRSTEMKTSDYGIFRSIDGNRKINKGHVLRLAEAIERKNLLQYFPILLNEDMEIIDGQHRLNAAMKLGYDVHYEVVPGLSLKDVMSINTNSKSWALVDFIDSYIELEKPDYVILKTFMDRYHMGATLSAALLSGFASLRGGWNMSMAIREGTFNVGLLEQAEKIADQVVELQKYSDFKLSRDREFILALLKLNKNNAFDFERLVAKLRMFNLKIEKRPSDKYYLILIEELYNFKTSTGKVELYVSSSK